MSNFQCHCCSKLCKRQNFQVLKPNANCVKVTFAASCSLYYTLQVNNVNCVVPPAGYIPQKWGVRRTPHTPRWRRPCSQSRIGDYRLVHDWQRSSSRMPYFTFVIQLLLGKCDEGITSMSAYLSCSFSARCNKLYSSTHKPYFFQFPTNYGPDN